MEKPQFSRRFWIQLALENPLGCKIEPEEAQAWFDMKWPKMRARGYRNVMRAVINWWDSLTSKELDAARQYLLAHRQREMQEAPDPGQEVSERTRSTVDRMFVR